MSGPITAIRKAASAMRRIERHHDETALNVARAGIPPEGDPNISLVDQQVRQIVDTHLYDANAAVIKTSDEMAEDALDIVG
jgi:flagellar basal body rod protein FlgG